MLPDRVSNPGPLTYESGALPIALRGPAELVCSMYCYVIIVVWYMSVKTALMLSAYGLGFV